MTLVEGPQIATSGSSGGSIDTTSGVKRSKTSAASILGELGALRTEVQIPLHDSFAPQGIVPRGSSFTLADKPPTMQRAKPPAWMDAPGVPCVPLGDMTRKDWDKHWDVRTDEEAAQLCSTCSVRETCLQDALEDEIGEDGSPLSEQSRYMVRGGLTPKGRWLLAAKNLGSADPK